MALLMQRQHSHLVSRQNLSHTERNVKLENNIPQKEQFIWST